MGPGREEAEAHHSGTLALLLTPPSVTPSVKGALEPPPPPENSPIPCGNRCPPQGQQCAMPDQSSHASRAGQCLVAKPLVGVGPIKAEGV